MKNAPQSNEHTKSAVKVPRDPNQRPTSGPTPRSPDRANIRDEDYTDRDKPLLGDSAAAKALQANPPKGKGQRGVGTAGDAARPNKEGIHGKPVPPRGQL